MIVACLLSPSAVSALWPWGVVMLVTTQAFPLRSILSPTLKTLVVSQYSVGLPGKKIGS